MPKPSKLVNLAVKALEDLKAIDLKVLHVEPHTTVTDWWVICTGTSTRHVKSLAENVVTKAKEAGERPRGIEGAERAEWVLVDLGSVVVHVLQAQARAHYQLEKLMPEDLPSARPPARKTGGKKTAAAKTTKPRRAAAGKKTGRRTGKPPAKRR
jgi:ribosome-associated protein